MNLYPWAIKHGVSLEALQDLKDQLGLNGGDAVADPPGTALSESTVSKIVRLEAAKKNILLWRNNVGAYQDDSGNFIRYGLANDTPAMNKRVKSSDLIGIKPNGQFICREVKAADWYYTGTPHEAAQLAFIDMILAKGGDAGFAVGEGSFKT